VIGNAGKLMSGLKVGICEKWKKKKKKRVNG
jgi:hypothetical protein